MFSIEALVIAGRPLLITLPSTIVFVGFMITSSYLEPMEFSVEAPILEIILFIVAIFVFVGLAYYIGGKKILKSDMAEEAKMDSFSKMIEDVEAIIEKMINNPKELPWYMSVEQLKMTVDELHKMNQIRDMKRFMPYYPRGIADSWDSNDNLGNELLKVLDFYMKF